MEERTEDEICDGQNHASSYLVISNSFIHAIGTDH